MTPEQVEWVLDLALPLGAPGDEMQAARWCLWVGRLWLAEVSAPLRVSPQGSAHTATLCWREDFRAGSRRARRLVWLELSARKRASLCWVNGEVYARGNEGAVTEAIAMLR